MTAPVAPTPVGEEERAARLRAAQAQAVRLFDAVGERDVIRPGVLDSAASQEVVALAADLFDMPRHWHKRIVRSGPNTLQPYQENPPDRRMTDDDIVFADFGPIFEGWEADFGRTWVLGDDPVKLRLRDDLAEVFAAGKAAFEAAPAMTAEALWAEVVALTEARGWTYGNTYCGHLVGEFPHENFDGARTDSALMAGNTTPIRTLDPSGRIAHWILEIHLVDRERQIGGFYEELLTL